MHYVYADSKNLIMLNLVNSKDLIMLNLVISKNLLDISVDFLVRLNFRFLEKTEIYIQLDVEFLHEVFLEFLIVLNKEYVENVSNSFF